MRIVGKEAQTHADLFVTADAVDAAGSVASTCQAGKQHRGEDCDHRYNDHQLNLREGPFAVFGW